MTTNSPCRYILPVVCFLTFYHNVAAAQVIRCADPQCELCLSTGWKSPETADTREPRHLPEDAPFGREASVAVVNPLFPSEYQSVITLKGDWDFRIDPDKVGLKENWMTDDAAWKNCRTMPVPGNWESHGVGEPGMSTPWICSWDQSPRPLRNVYIGSAWYRKTFRVPETEQGRRHWLKIGGVRAQGWFWVNGQPVAKVASYCGTFRFEITDLVKPGEDATIVALVRNDVPGKTGCISSSHIWGGIYRDIEIESTPDVHLANVECVGNYDTQSVDVHVAVWHPDTAAGEEIELRVDVTDKIAAAVSAARKVKLAAGDKTSVVLSVKPADFRAWSPESPNLYLAEVRLYVNTDKSPVHGWNERFGVKKMEVRGDRFFLNDKPYFLRGYGDDYVYPETFISPTDRDVHRRNLKLARDAGFVYVRHHTHCEIPEYYDAADELGVMIQPELPYYPFNGHHTTELFDFDPKRDLNELIDHYRRHVSLTTYSMGNEGHLGTPLDVELKELVKKRDPGRLVLHNDGGVCTPENSDFDAPNSYCWPLHPTSSIVPWKPGTFDYMTMPFIAHEYMNLGLKFDPRLSPKFTGAMMPPRPLDRYEQRLVEAGLDRVWGDACLDAGHRLQRHYQKEGIEAARLDPACDGYSFWTIIDVIVRYGEGDSYTGQGVFSPFWEPKPHGTTPDELAKFNSPTALLMTPEKESFIWCEGESVRLGLWASHFAYDDIPNAVLNWRLKDGGATVLSGKLDGFSLKTGDVKQIGSAEFVVPKIETGKHFVFEANLDGVPCGNDWSFWAFPRREKPTLRNICVTPDLLDKLVTKYDGMTKLDDDGMGTNEILVASPSHPAIRDALAAGKTVLQIDPTQGPDNVKLGWWWIGDQTGTAFADHPAFGEFPHDGFLGPLWFRLIKRGLPLGKDLPFERMEYLSVGEGRDDYFLYLGQTRFDGGGKLLCVYGFDVLSEHPEADFLLDQWIRYIQSDAFRPATTSDLNRSGTP